MKQDSANYSTPLCYSKNNCRFVNYLCMYQLKRTPGYSTQVQVEYLYFSQMNRTYNTINTNKFLPPPGFEPGSLGTRQMTAKQMTYPLCYGAPRSINFTIWLRLNLGHQLLVFASKTKSGVETRFAKI